MNRFRPEKLDYNFEVLRRKGSKSIQRKKDITTWIDRHTSRNSNVYLGNHPLSLENTITRASIVKDRGFFLQKKDSKQWISTIFISTSAVSLFTKFVQYRN